MAKLPKRVIHLSPEQRERLDKSINEYRDKLQRGEYPGVHPITDYVERNSDGSFCEIDAGGMPRREGWFEKLPKWKQRLSPADLHAVEAKEYQDWEEAERAVMGGLGTRMQRTT